MARSDRVQFKQQAAILRTGERPWKRNARSGSAGAALCTLWTSTREYDTMAHTAHMRAHMQTNITSVPTFFMKTSMHRSDRREPSRRGPATHAGLYSGTELMCSSGAGGAAHNGGAVKWSNQWHEIPDLYARGARVETGTRCCLGRSPWLIGPLPATAGGGPPCGGAAGDASGTESRVQGAIGTVPNLACRAQSVPNLACLRGGAWGGSFVN